MLYKCYISEVLYKWSVIYYLYVTIILSKHNMIRQTRVECIKHMTLLSIKNWFCIWLIWDFIEKV